jgi:hypothetical protein
MFAATHMLLASAAVAQPAVQLISVSAAACEVAGAAGTSTASVTPTMPPNAIAGDRIYIVTAHSAGPLSGTPGGWTQVWSINNLGRQIGLRRDYDGIWTMPTLALTSGNNRAQCVLAFCLRKRSGLSWSTPTVETATDSSSGTGFSATTASFATHADGFLAAICSPTSANGTGTFSGGNITQSGATFDAITKIADGGTTLGNDAALKVLTTIVRTGATGAVTASGTLSVASTAELAILEQRAS